MRSQLRSTSNGGQREDKRAQTSTYTFESVHDGWSRRCSQKQLIQTNDLCSSFVEGSVADFALGPKANRFNINNPDSDLIFPFTEDTLCRFVAFLGQEGLKHHTFKLTYQASDLCKSNKHLAIHSSRTTCPCWNIFSQASNTLKHGGPRPLTLGYLGSVGVVPHACTGFFSFLRAGEFTIPSL